MAKLIIWQGGDHREVEFSAPTSLDDILQQENIHVSHPCGGRGACGKCTVTLAGCVSEPTPMEQKAGVRLSCQVVLLGNAAVWLSEERAMEQIEISGTEASFGMERLAPMEGKLERQSISAQPLWH